MIALGMDGMRFLESRDNFERNLMVAMAQEAFKTKQLLDKNLAAEITNNVAKIIGGK